jgi:hypothetical protein
VQKSTSMPSPDRLSVLAATILLAYASIRLVDLPPSVFNYQLPGFFLSVEISAATLITLLAAGLMATGADLLLRDHPLLKGKFTLQHWLLPAMTAWIIGVPLYRLPLSPQWLAGFAIGGALLMLVLIAEYISVDPQDRRYPLASAGLTAASFALFLMLAIAMRSIGLRLFFILPTLTFASALVILRTLHLRLRGRWLFLETAALALIIAQLAAAFHYLPLSPIAYGLAILGPAYALTSLIASISEGISLRQAVLEPSLALVAMWGSALLAR